MHNTTDYNTTVNVTFVTIGRKDDMNSVQDAHVQTATYVNSVLTSPKMVDQA